MKGAREVQEQVLAVEPDPSLQVLVVWAPIMKRDSLEEANSAMKLIPDSRAFHFWDQEKQIPFRFAKAVDLPKGAPFAWDIYLLYGKGSNWDSEIPPRPQEWLAQLQNLDREKRFKPDRLLEKLRALLQHSEEHK